MPEAPFRNPILGGPRTPPAMTPEGGYFSGPGTDPGYYTPPPLAPPIAGPPGPRDGDPEPIGGMVGRPSVGVPPQRRPVHGGPGFQPPPEPIPIFNFPPRRLPPGVPVREPVRGGPGFSPGRMPIRSPLDEMGLWELAMRRMQQYY